MAKNYKEDTEEKVKKAKKTRINKDIEQADVSDLIKSDDKIKQYKRIVKTIAEGINLDKLNKEVAGLHAGRTSRLLYGKTPGGERLMTASLQDSSVRSRMAEVRVEVTRQASILERATATIRKHLLNEFREHASGFKTKGERTSFADQYLTRGLELHATLEDFTNRVDFLIKDIDQTGFSLKHAIACLELTYSHNSGASKVNR